MGDFAWLRNRTRSFAWFHLLLTLVLVTAVRQEVVTLIDRRQNRNGADTAFNDDVGRAANHHEMFDIVTAHQNQPATGINGCRIQNLQARLAISATADEGRRAATPLDQPQGNSKKY
jgi:hypothetical protein